MKLLVVASRGAARQHLAESVVTLGHSVVEVSSTREARDRLRREAFDVVMVDTDRSASQVPALLGAVGRWCPRARVVRLTQNPSSPAVPHGIDAMFAGSLVKPIRAPRVRDLLTRLHRELPAGVGEPPHARPAPPSRDRLTHVRLDDLPHDLGEGRLERAVDRAPEGGPPLRELRIEAADASPNLLGRLLVGSYITGQDRVFVVSRKGLTDAQRAEVRRTADRLLGTTVVRDLEDLIEVQNFVDPGKHPLPHLLRRVVWMLQTELAACREALDAGGPGPRALVDSTEDEVDRLYLLIARQLLLSSDSPRIAEEIDVASHHYQMGYRLVAKMLEVTGDRIQGIATELDRIHDRMRRVAPSVTRPLSETLARLERFLGDTMDAFTLLSARAANVTLNRIDEALPGISSMGDAFAQHLDDRDLAVAFERTVCHLVMSLEMLAIVNEVTINRCVEPETVAARGARALLGTLAPATPTHPTP